MLNTIELFQERGELKVAYEEIKVKIITEEREFENMHEEWNNLAERSDGHIFQTFEWNRIWWKHFGTNKQLHLVTMYDDGKLIAIFPLFWDEIHYLGLLRYSCLRFIGSNVHQPFQNELLGLISYTDSLDVLVDRNYEEEVFDQFIRHLEHIKEKIDEIVFDVIPERSAIHKYLIPKLRESGFSIRKERTDMSLLIKLEGSWDNYLKSISKNSRSHARRALKKVNQKSRKIFDIHSVETREAISEKFDQMVQMHQERWNRLGALGTFWEEKNFRFHKEIALAFYEKGWLQLLYLTSLKGCKILSIDLNYRYKRCLYGVHCALDDQSYYYKMGPGKSLLNATLFNASLENIDKYTFLRGSESYKADMANHKTFNSTWSVFHNGVTAGVKVRVLKKLMHFQRKMNRKVQTVIMMVNQRLGRPTDKKHQTNGMVVV